MDKNAMHRIKKKIPAPMRKIIRFWLSLFLLLIILAAVMLEYLALTEYRPEQREILEVNQLSRDEISPGDSLKILTWNCGYGALGDNADFFMEGGKGVQTADKDRVQKNLEGILEETARVRPDVIFYQEIDRDATRSYHIDQVITAVNTLMLQYDLLYSPAFAYNFKVKFVPYPIPPIGKVESGLLTLTSLKTESAERIQLPSMFNWPVRLANLKRCLLVERVPIQNSDRELVLINLHLEAYDSGAGKEAQARMLVEILQEEIDKGNYVIAGGDFNQTFSNTDLSAYPYQEDVWTPGVMDVEELEEKGLQCLMDNRTPTARALNKPYAGADHDNFQYYVIDGFILSSNIALKSCETIGQGFVCTDHNPVLLECELEQN